MSNNQRLQDLNGWTDEQASRYDDTTKPNLFVELLAAEQELADRQARTSQVRSENNRLLHELNITKIKLAEAQAALVAAIQVIARTPSQDPIVDATWVDLISGKVDRMWDMLMLKNAPAVYPEPPAADDGLPEELYNEPYPTED